MLVATLIWGQLMAWVVAREKFTKNQIRKMSTALGEMTNKCNKTTY